MLDESDGFSIVAPGSRKGQGTLSDARLENLVIPNCGTGTQGRHGLWVREDARGRLTIANSKIVTFKSDSKNFEILDE